jgi:crotonobetainyl-CoA:carnitine CoA-transferase CaiB-like acyl-CoA transferase
MAGVLDGIRVLDFGRYIAGPYCATLLAELGADVIRIEKIGGSEDRPYTPVGAEAAGALFLQMARNKRGMTLKPTTPAGREIVRRLVATADVVVANLPPPALAQMGIDYDSLCAAKPDIILATTSAFGRGGPMSERVGFDGIGQAMCGAMYLSGWPEAPMRAYLPYVDFGTALYSAVGTLAALMERANSGRGQMVETSLLGTALSFNNAALIEQAMIKPDRVATGNRGQVNSPNDAFQTLDGWLLVQVVGNQLFRRWAKLMGEDDPWLTDPRFADDRARGDHRDLVCGRMAEWCGARTTDQCLAELDQARIPAGPVLSPQQALDHPHIQAMHVMLPIDFPGLARPAPVARVPMTLSATPGEVRTRAPLLGEHTDAILADIGYDTDAIAALRAEGTV